MYSYQEVSNQEEMERLFSSISRFHDSMTKEMHIINRGAVIHDKKMVMSHQFDAQLLVQSQWEPYAIELLFIDVLELVVRDPSEYYGASGSVERKPVPVEEVKIQMEFDSSLTISARRLFYRVRSECLGMKAYLNSEIPSPNAILAKIIDGQQWRQCSSCSDVWEEDISQSYSVCPKCLLLTEIMT